VATDFVELIQSSAAAAAAIAADSRTRQADEEEDVDWEDGWENIEDRSVIERETTEDSHAVAVEHTLAAMKSAGGLTGGELEIDFAQPHTELANHNDAIRSEAIELA
jgi:hypothetical protein